MATQPTPKSNNDLLREQLEAFKTLRDELRVQAHLGGLEAKEAWSRIEPQFDSLVRDAQKAGHVTVGALNELLVGFKRFMAAVKYQKGPQA
ncbi:MAG: hypothetical protein JST54_12355 [Deltaproteobacteria bacterium]|nr:hypothetical protein [Deltaproteobacteria bacterium]